MFRRAPPTLLAIFMSNVAMADVVRHNSLPNSYSGAWTTSDSDYIFIDAAARTYADNEESCAVNWVSETPGASGPIYSAHLQCSRRSDRTGKSFPLDLIIWPKGADEIEVGPGFVGLKIFHRCRAERPPPQTGNVRSRSAPPSATDTSSQGECRFDANM